MKTTGFIGLGHMGAAMAQRLLRAGQTLLVYDLDPTARTRLLEAGAQEAASASEVAQRCSSVFLCLPSPQASRNVVLQLRERPGPLTVVVETSTVGPQAVRELGALLAARHIDLLDAPVSGGPRGAEAGTLSMMVAGSARAAGQVQVQLQHIAGRLFHVGSEPGLAQVCKLVNNAISAAGMMAACEATVVGVKAGLDAQTLLDAINAGSGRNAATMDKFPRSILPGTFDYGGPLGLMLKDLALFIEQAQDCGASNLMAPATLAAWQEAVRRNGPDADYSRAIRHMEIDAGVQVRARGASQE